MYYSFFLIYLITGFAITLCIFMWAVKNGQFRDQQRASFIPLQAEQEAPTLKVSRFNRYQAYALFGFFFSCLLAGVAVIIYALVRGG